VLDYVKNLAQTMMEAHDRFYIEKADFARTVAIPTLGLTATDFTLSRERALALHAAGRIAAETFLQTWDFDGYIAEFRRGKEHSRRREVAAEMAEAATHVGAT
jgi:NTE family protein